ncbi:MAG TPA: MarR family transcriptional regulator [Verrucomicrobiae bacterium]|nr:MarR family transcriptional regulator [Verrucomicrobiae bacterium]
MTPDSQPKSVHLIEQFALTVFTANDLLMQNGDRLTKDLGQSSARWQVLGRVYHQPQTVAGIARTMGHARQSVQRIADALAADGLVIFKDNPADRRTKLLQVTPEGERILQQIALRNAAWAEAVITKLDLRQLEEVVTGLTSIAEVMAANLYISTMSDQLKNKEERHAR